MKYYEFEISSDKKVIGNTSGDAQVRIIKEMFTDPFKFDELDKALDFYNYNGAISDLEEKEFEIQYAEMHPKAKVTDFMEYSPYLRGCPFVVSEKALSFINKLNIKNFVAWPFKLIIGKTNEQYYLFYINTSNDDIIDFSKSKFYVGSSFGKREWITFDSAKEKETFQKNNFGLKLGKISFIESFLNEELDLFKLSDTSIIISERLKRSLENEGFTGAEFISTFSNDPRRLEIGSNS